MIDFDTFEMLGLKMSIAKDDGFFWRSFNEGLYWDHNTLVNLQRDWIDPSKNIVEIGSHCGTSTCFYATLTSKKVFAFEPQRSMFELLNHNIKQNNLTNVIASQTAMFYTQDNLKMDDMMVHKLENNIYNRGGLGLGIDGEDTKSITLNDLDVDDCGFLHIDAQGAEQHIMYSGLRFIENHRPVILWENNIKYDKPLCDRVNLIPSIPQCVKEFDIEKALSDLGYTNIPRWSGIDTLSIPRSIYRSK